MPDSGSEIGKDFLEVITRELRKIKAQGEKAIAQVTDDRKLHVKLDEESNTIDILIRHLAGNFDPSFSSCRVASWFSPGPVLCTASRFYGVALDGLPHGRRGKADPKPER
jgi:hypothetical protein